MGQGLQGRGREGEGHHGGQQQGRPQERGRPTQPAGEHEATGTHRQHRGPVPQGPGRRPAPPLSLGQQVDAVGIHHHVLAGAHHRQENRHGAHHGELGGIGLGPQQGHATDHRHQSELQHQEPAAAAIRPGDGPAIEQRGPEQLEGVREFGEAQQADHPQGDAAGREPTLQQLAAHHVRGATGHPLRSHRQETPPRGDRSGGGIRSHRRRAGLAHPRSGGLKAQAAAPGRSRGAQPYRPVTRDP